METSMHSSGGTGRAHWTGTDNRGASGSVRPVDGTVLARVSDEMAKASSADGLELVDLAEAASPPRGGGFLAMRKGAQVISTDSLR